ncbi:MAG: hypothetical protein A2Z14_12690 [Chloroflexi bacterium RBG_16_48_8]|nr:MAG: hypothetical protein A2Z14_12690 [Chloroflexi bacterium RBG_16_48_8]
MARHSRLLNELNRYWNEKLEGRGDLVERLTERDVLPQECSSSPVELVAACSLLTARKPIHEVLKSVACFSPECDAPGFDDDFFQQLQATLRDFEIAGLRSYSRKPRKVGLAIVGMHHAKDWQEHWSRETKRKPESAIRDKPFYPQPG